MLSKVIVGSDLWGWDLKRHITTFLNGLLGYDSVTDISKVKPLMSVDYAGVAEQVANVVADVQKGTVGILIGSTGMGMCLAANKVRGVRATACYTKRMAFTARRNMDSNMLCLGGDISASSLAIELIGTWLNTPFSNKANCHRQITYIKELEIKQVMYSTFGE